MTSAEFRTLKVFEYDYAYLDSGAPASYDYTTWVILHGLGFNGAVFEKLLPIAHAHNLRIVSVNRRGYAPSSGFEEDESKGIGAGKTFAQVEPYFRAQGAEIATFLFKFVAEHGIPATVPNSHTGGIVLVGWSLGSVHVNAFLAYIDEQQQEVRSTLRKYVHTTFCHDPSATFGIPDPPNFDLSIWSKIEPSKLFDAFFGWVTGHYTHKSVTSRNADDLEFNHPSDRPHSLCELSSEQRARYTCREAYGGCDGKLVQCDKAVFAQLAKRALFDKARAEAFPGVRVRYMGGGTSSGILIWTLWMVDKYLKNPKSLYGVDAEKARDVEWIVWPEGNHFVFWEDPEKAIEQYHASIAM